MKCPSCGATLPATDLDCLRCGAHVGWWVKLQDGQETGPYTFLEMQTFIRQEQISPSDRVRLGLIGPWRPAPEVLRPDYGKPDGRNRTPSAAPARSPRPVLPAAWLAVSALLVAGLIVLGTVVVVTRSRRPANGTDQVCLQNLRHLASALRMYADDTGGRMPHWRAWAAAALPHLDTPGTFLCPAAPAEPGYAYNAALGGVPTARIADSSECAMLWDAGALGPSAGLATGYNLPRHNDGDNYAFVDGHAAWRRRGARVRVGVELRPE